MEWLLLENGRVIDTFPSHTKAKNATMGEYKKATGFEAVLGYNYMKGERERLDFFVERALNKAGYL